MDWEFSPCPGNPPILVRAAAWEEGGYRRLRITYVVAKVLVQRVAMCTTSTGARKRASKQQPSMAFL